MRNPHRPMDPTRPPIMDSQTPWGPADTVNELAPGIVAVTTPSHGGLWLSPERYAQIPESLRAVARRYAPAPWFEEDCDACIVGWIFRAELQTDPTLAPWLRDSATLFAARPEYYGAFGYRIGQHATPRPGDTGHAIPRR